MKVRLIATTVVAWCATIVTAQSLEPQFHMWGAAPSGWNNHQFLPMLFANRPNQSHMSDPELVAVALADDIQAYFDAGLPMDKIDILIFNFGQWSGGPVVSLIDMNDMLYEEPDWFSEPEENEVIRFQQPWMTMGREKVKTWMQHFLTAYIGLTYDNGTEDVPLPIPARFHFDTELTLIGCCQDVNDTRVLEAIAKDSRYTDSSYPVPGSGGKTMAELYADAVDLYGWDPEVDLEDALFLNQGQDQDNRPYFLWYYGVCQRARDAAMKEVAYDVISSYFENDTPKVSNYGDAATNDDPGTFGWYSRPDYSASYPWPLIPDRHSINARPIESRAGAQYIIGDLQWSGHQSVWLMEEGTASGDFSAPQLYTFDYPHLGANYYTAGPADESLWDASLRNHRHWIESILNSGKTPEQISPWVPMVLANTHKVLEYTVTAEDVRRQLAMLRAKNIGEILVWWNPDSLSPDWHDYARTVQQVYTPMLQSYMVIEGTGTQEPEESALQYTLVDTGEDTVIVESSSSAIAGIKVVFDGLWPNTSEPKLGDHLRLNLELAVYMDDMGSTDRDALRVRAYMYKPSITSWVVVPCGDYSNDQMGLFAPIELLPQEPSRCDLRRTLTIDHCIVEDDELQVKVVVYTAAESTFTVAFDLVQLYWADDGAVACEPIESLQGADMNYSGSVSTPDLTKFTSDYMNGKPAADFNNDGVVNASDMAAFLAKYAQ